MNLEDTKQEANNLPLAYRDKALRQLGQIEEGQRHGVDVAAALASLTEEVASIKARLGLDKVAGVHTMHLTRFESPWGEGLVDEARRKVTVGDVEFSEGEIDVLLGKGLGRQAMGLVISAKREFEGKVIGGFKSNFTEARIFTGRTRRP